MALISVNFKEISVCEKIQLLTEMDLIPTMIFKVTGISEQLEPSTLQLAQYACLPLYYFAATYSTLF